MFTNGAACAGVMLSTSPVSMLVSRCGLGSGMGSPFPFGATLPSCDRVMLCAGSEAAPCATFETADAPHPQSDAAAHAATRYRMDIERFPHTVKSGER